MNLFIYQKEYLGKDLSTETLTQLTIGRHGNKINKHKINTKNTAFILYWMVKKVYRSFCVIVNLERLI